MQPVADRNNGRDFPIIWLRILPLPPKGRGRSKERWDERTPLSQREMEISHLYLSLWSYLKVALQLESTRDKNEASPVLSGLASFLKKMVRMRGLEPPRCHHHRLLRPARLPVPPHPHAVKSLCEWVQTVSRKQISTAVPGNALTIIVHASHSSFAITQEVVSHFAISPVTQDEIIIIEVTIASNARRQNVTNSTTAWSATVPTSIAGVMAVSELCAFLVVPGQAPCASRPTCISDLASPLSPAAILP